VAMDSGEIAFDGAPSDFLAWAIGHDPPLATPGARLFSLAGIEPLPVGVKHARDLLASDGWEGEAHPSLSHHSREERERSSDDRKTRSGAKRSRWATPPHATSLEARDLWVELDRGEEVHDVLRGVELQVDAAERVALMGRNGAGKTTFLRTAAGLIEPVHGKIEVHGEVALLGQSPDDYLVRERVGEELPGNEGRTALATVGLEHVRDSDPRDLSGGERQRLALAIALAGRTEGGEVPGLVMLDEPTRGMDRGRKDELAGLIADFAARGAAVLVATHDVEFAATFAERVVLLGDGTVIADGAAPEVLSGGWYFATEVARILGMPGVVTPEAGAELIGGAG
jgi:energy-coupling factor transporter ATP-binding protein EcfA2